MAVPDQEKNFKRKASAVVSTPKKRPKGNSARIMTRSHPGRRDESPVEEVGDAVHLGTRSKTSHSRPKQSQLSISSSEDHTPPPAVGLSKFVAGLRNKNTGNLKQSSEKRSWNTSSVISISSDDEDSRPRKRTRRGNIVTEIIDLSKDDPVDSPSPSTPSISAPLRRPQLRPKPTPLPRVAPSGPRHLDLRRLASFPHSPKLKSKTKTTVSQPQKLQTPPAHPLSKALPASPSSLTLPKDSVFADNYSDSEDDIHTAKIRADKVMVVKKQKLTSQTRTPPRRSKRVPAPLPIPLPRKPIKEELREPSPFRSHPPNEKEEEEESVDERESSPQPEILGDEEKAENEAQEGIGTPSAPAVVPISVGHDPYSVTPPIQDSSPTDERNHQRHSHYNSQSPHPNVDEAVNAEGDDNGSPIQSLTQPLPAEKEDSLVRPMHTTPTLTSTPTPTFSPLSGSFTSTVTSSSSATATTPTLFIAGQLTQKFFAQSCLPPRRCSKTEILEKVVVQEQEAKEMEIGRIVNEDQAITYAKTTDSTTAARNQDLVECPVKVEREDEARNAQLWIHDEVDVDALVDDEIAEGEGVVVEMGVIEVLGEAEQDIRDDDTVKPLAAMDVDLRDEELVDVQNLSPIDESVASAEGEDAAGRASPMKDQDDTANQESDDMVMLHVVDHHTAIAHSLTDESDDAEVAMDLLPALEPELSDMETHQEDPVLATVSEAITPANAPGTPVITEDVTNPDYLSQEGALNSAHVTQEDQQGASDTATTPASSMVEDVEKQPRMESITLEKREPVFVNADPLRVELTTTEALEKDPTMSLMLRTSHKLMSELVILKEAIDNHDNPPSPPPALTPPVVLSEAIVDDVAPCPLDKMRLSDSLSEHRLQSVDGVTVADTAATVTDGLGTSARPDDGHAVASVPMLHESIPLPSDSTVDVNLILPGEKALSIVVPGADISSSTTISSSTSTSSFATSDNSSPPTTPPADFETYYIRSSSPENLEQDAYLNLKLTDVSSIPCASDEDNDEYLLSLNFAYPDF